MRVDSHDNIWTVDEGANLVTTFDPTGTKVLLVIGFRPPVSDLLTTAGAPTGPDDNYELCRPTDVAHLRDAQDNIFISDGYCNNRVLKYDKYGKFLAKIGKRAGGNGTNQYNLPHGLQVDKAEQRLCRRPRQRPRYVVLDNNLTWKTAYTDYGSTSVRLHQHRGAQAVSLHVSNSNPNGNTPGNAAQTGQIYKAELDGTVIGKFGHAGKLAPGFRVSST